MEEPKSTAKRGAKTAAAAQEDRITLLPLSELHDFPNHPFKVRDDETMQETAESIRQYGVLVPAIVRPREDGGYEIIAGHRRRHGSELAGLSAMPCIVRQMDDDTATILMVDSNIQRENILPSERAQAYKMKLEAIKRQGTRHDLTSDQLGQKLSGKTSREVIAENSNDSPTAMRTRNTKTRTMRTSRRKRRTRMHDPFHQKSAGATDDAAPLSGKGGNAAHPRPGGAFLLRLRPLRHRLPPPLLP